MNWKIILLTGLLYGLGFFLIGDISAGFGVLVMILSNNIENHFKKAPKDTTLEDTISKFFGEK